MHLMMRLEVQLMQFRLQKHDLLGWCKTTNCNSSPRPPLLSVYHHRYPDLRVQNHKSVDVRSNHNKHFQIAIKPPDPFVHSLIETPIPFSPKSQSLITIQFTISVTDHHLYLLWCDIYSSATNIHHRCRNIHHQEHLSPPPWHQECTLKTKISWTWN